MSLIREARQRSGGMARSQKVLLSQRFFIKTRGAWTSAVSMSLWTSYISFGTEGPFRQMKGQNSRPRPFRASPEVSLHSYGVQPNAQRRTSLNQMCVQFLYLCVFITAGPSTKLFAWGGGDVGGHVQRETTSRGLGGLVCPSRTSQRGGEGDCVKEGGGGEGKCERERALERLRCYIPGH